MTQMITTADRNRSWMAGPMWCMVPAFSAVLTGRFFLALSGQKFLTLFSNVLNNLNLTDMKVGYKVFRRQLLQSDSAEIEPLRF